MRGGANGARVRLNPQRFWQVNNPTQLSKILDVLEGIQKGFGKDVSLADLIVLGGCAAIEDAAREAGSEVSVTFIPGRTDASEADTDVESFAVLEPFADGFRNYMRAQGMVSMEGLLIDKAHLLNLTAPEMTVLIGGMRALNTNWDGSDYGILTNNPGQLTNDFFVNLLDMGTEWSLSILTNLHLKAKMLKETLSGKLLESTSSGSNSELRALAEVYAQDDNKQKFLNDFAAAWNKVMMNDRFDLA